MSYFRSAAFASAYFASTHFGPSEAVVEKPLYPGVANVKVERPKSRPVSVLGAFGVETRSVVSLRARMPVAKVSVVSPIHLGTSCSVAIGVVDTDLLTIALTLED